MKPSSIIIACLSAVGLLTCPATAQGLSSRDTQSRAENGSQAFAFLRIPLGDPIDRLQPEFGIGFGFADHCLGASRFDAQSGASACDVRPFRSIELSGGLNDAPWTLSLRGASRRTNIIDWSPHTGELSLAGEGGGSGDWIWIGLGVAAGLGIVAALSGEDDPTLCTGNTIPNPLTGECEPLVLN